MRVDKENALKESNKCVCLLTRALMRVEAIQLSHFGMLFKIVVAHN